MSSDCLTFAEPNTAPLVGDMRALPRAGQYGAIYADPPWRFNVWNKTTAVQARASKSTYKSTTEHYQTLNADDIAALPVGKIAADDCALFMWACWPTLLLPMQSR